MKKILAIFLMLTLFGCSQNNQSPEKNPFGTYNTRKVKREVLKIIRTAPGLADEPYPIGDAKYRPTVGMAHGIYDDLPFVTSATYGVYVQWIEGVEGLIFWSTNEHWEVIILDPSAECPDELSYFEKVADYVYYSELKHE